MNPFRPIADWMINLLGGATLSDIQGIEQVYVTELDKARVQREALTEHILKFESLVLDLKETRLIAASVPDGDWTVTAMRTQMDNMAQQLAALTDKAESRRRRAKELAQQRERNARGRFISNHEQRGY